MRKIILLSLFSTLLIIYGCKKEEHTDSIENIAKMDNVEEKHSIESLEILSEEGDVIKNTEAPKKDGENSDLIQTVKKDSSIDTNNENIDNFFKAVISSNNISDIDLFLNKGIDINVLDKNGENALSVAIKASNMVTLKYLIEKGANLNNTTDTGLPPLSLAIMLNNMQALDLLLNEKNIDMYYIWGDVWTGTPLYTSVSTGNFQALEKLIAKGINVNHSYAEYGAMPIMVYALNHVENLPSKNYINIISLLIKNGADINTADSKGVTPLMQSLKNNDKEGFMALINSKADISLKDNKGEDALSYYNKYVKPSEKIIDEDKLKIESLLK